MSSLLTGAAPASLAAGLLVLAHSATAGYWYNQPQLYRARGSAAKAVVALSVLLVTAGVIHPTGVAGKVAEWVALGGTVVLTGVFCMDVTVFIGDRRKYALQLAMAFTNLSLALTMGAYLLDQLAGVVWTHVLYEAIVTNTVLMLVGYVVTMVKRGPGHQEYALDQRRRASALSRQTKPATVSEG